MEAALIWGTLENTERLGASNYENPRVPDDDGWNIRQFGIATQAEFRAIEERLKAEHADNPDLPYWLMTLSYGRHVCQARLHWCDEALTMLSGQADHAQTAPSKRPTAA